MISSKCQKYMNQYQERNYAPKVRKVEKGDIRKHSNGSEIGKTSETSCSNSIQQSREKQEEIIQKSNQGRCETEETNIIQTKGKKMKKQAMKEKKHEAKETKAYEKKEEKKESKSTKK